MDEGMTLVTAAGGFIGSQEFIGLYGAAPTDVQFVTALYQNALHRAPDPAGLSGWIAALTSGQLTRAQVLIGFSESPENKGNTDGATKSGIEVL